MSLWPGLETGAGESVPNTRGKSRLPCEPITPGHVKRLLPEPRGLERRPDSRQAAHLADESLIKGGQEPAYRGGMLHSLLFSLSLLRKFSLPLPFRGGVRTKRFENSVAS